MADTILVERDGAIATVILNRPEKLNALTRPMWKRLGEVFSQLSADDALRCIVIRGAGTKAFAPGNDISEFATERSNIEQARAYGEDMRRTIEAIATCRHPVVAQIHGICVGGGLEIAGLADIRICGSSSRFGAPINKLGLVMAYAEIGSLISLAGEATALEILLEGRVFDAAEALAKGLVTRVVPDDQVEHGGTGDGAAHCRWSPARGALAQEVRPAAARRKAPHARGVRRGLCMLWHRRLPDRLQGVSCQAKT